MSRLFTRLNKDGLHSHNALSYALDFLASKFYLATIAIRPTTPTIYNVSTTNANWTPIATGLTGVLKWRLTEKSGNDFYYAYVSSPTAFMTGFGWVADDTAPTAIYAKRPATTNVDMQLEVWTA